MFVCKLKEDNSVRDACSTADATGCCNVTLAMYAMGDKKYRTGRYCYIFGDKLI